MSSPLRRKAQRVVRHRRGALVGNAIKRADDVGGTPRGGDRAKLEDQSVACQANCLCISARDAVRGRGAAARANRRQMANSRCRMHGGTNPYAPQRNRNVFKHGRYTAEAIPVGARSQRSFARCALWPALERVIPQNAEGRQVLRRPRLLRYRQEWRRGDRAGITAAARNGASVGKMKKISRHKSTDVLAGCVREANCSTKHANVGIY
jgi:hypothetical protein